MSESESVSVFNPLENENHEAAQVPGIKRPGEQMETYEATFADTQLIELDLDKYVDDFNRRVIGAYQDAMGIRARWDQRGWGDKKLWVIGGDGAMYDIGFQSLSRMLASGMDINVLILDTQVYSKTGGQASTATFAGQEAKMAAFGKNSHGKRERRKELAQICHMHADIYVAQTTRSAH